MTINIHGNVQDVIEKTVFQETIYEIKDLEGFRDYPLFYKRNGSGCSEQELDGRVLFRSLSGVIRFILYVIDV